MKSNNDAVALQALEFWSTVCDEEIDLALASDEAGEYDEAPDRESMHFARVALPEILPVVLTLLSKQDEDASEDEWDVSMAAGTTLALLAQCVGDAIVTPIIPYVEAHIKSPDWHHREAAVLAFGSILDGPDAKLLSPLVAQALPTLIEMIRDPDVRVKDTAAWTLGRISDLLVTTIKTDVHLPNMVAALVAGLQDSSRVATNCCWSFMNLAEQLNEPGAESSPLSPYYEGIVNALLGYAQRCAPFSLLSMIGIWRCRTEPRRTRRRPATKPALPSSVSHRTTACPSSTRSLWRSSNVLRAPCESRTSCWVPMRATNTMRRRSICAAYWRCVRSPLTFCAPLGLTTAQSIIRRLGGDVHPLADRIMTLLLGLISTSGKQSPILEDAFLCIGALISSTSRFSTACWRDSELAQPSR